MAKDSPKLFGVPIADGVHRQLERRKKIVSHNGKNDNVSVQEANLLKNRGGALFSRNVHVLLTSEKEHDISGFLVGRFSKITIPSIMLVQC